MIHGGNLKILLISILIFIGKRIPILLCGICKFWDKKPCCLSVTVQSVIFVIAALRREGKRST
jgi:hypothetical protein